MASVPLHRDRRIEIHDPAGDSSLPLEQHRLENGLRIILSPGGEVPVVAVNIGYDVGSRHEEPGRTGFAHLFEHLMFQGSLNVAKGEHAALVEAVGGSWNAGTWVDHTNFYEAVPSHHLELALWLEAERLTNFLPAMTQEKLDNQRDVVRNERRENVDNQPYGSWDERIHGLVFPPGHPYHHPTIGSLEDLAAASLDDVNRFFVTHYAPNTAVLSVVGDFDPDEALEMIRRHFGPISPSPTVRAAPDMTVPSKIGTEIREVVADAVGFVRVYVAHRIPPWGTSAFEAFEVASDLLGAGQSSRLYQRMVREERQALDVGALVFPFAHGATMFAAWATARPGVASAAIERALTASSEELWASDATDEELDRARSLHRTALAKSLEEVTERAERLSLYAALFNDPARVNTDAQRYAAVTASQIREACRRAMTADNRVVLTFVPERSSQ